MRAAQDSEAVRASRDRRRNVSGRAAALVGLAVLVEALVPSASAQAGRAWIEDPTGRAALQVAFRQHPSYADLAEAQGALTRMAAILCDSTEGQVRIEQIRLTTSPADEDLAAFWFHEENAASGGPYDRSGADLRRLGAHMDVFASARLRPDRLAHLFGHHAFGLGDQYDDQRRFSTACGIGPGFEAGSLSENNHSIMQASGGMRCIDGPLLGQDCVRDDECAGAECKAVLASEWSVALNHDLRRGDGDACPRPSPVSRVRLGGLLPSRAIPIRAFDGRDFLSARASSVWHEEIEVLGPGGTLPGIRLHFFLSHTDRLHWQLSVGADASEFGGPPGQFRVLESWALLFNEDYSLAAAHPAELLLALPTVGDEEALQVAIDIGTRNPEALERSGQGHDGLQMVTAGEPRLELVFDGVVGCMAQWCASSWSEPAGRWETSEQTLLHGGASDWQTLTRNLPFLAAPLSSPVADPPERCRIPPEFVTDVMGTDQVVLVLDTSRSMGLRVDGQAGEVCSNGLDDDEDSQVDEDDCADSRLEYERVATRAFLALAADRNLQVGLVAMHTDAEIVSGVDEVGGPRRAVIGAVLGSLRADGETALGTALEKAQEALREVERLGRSRTVILMTDGARNVGVVPGQEARLLDPLLYRAFPIGIGHAADGLALAAIAARGGGVAFATEEATGTPAILAELAARQIGSAPVLARTPFDLASPSFGQAAASKGNQAGSSSLPSSREFGIPVEEKADELVVFLGSRNARIDDWRLFFELTDPAGQRIDETAAQSRAERGFLAVRISDPRPGRWNLRVLPGGEGVQRSEVLAYTSNARAEFFVDADPRLAMTSRGVRISARPSYVTDIDGLARIEGVVRRPDGSEAPVALERDPFTRNWTTEFEDFRGRGHYEIRLQLSVGPAARPAQGEPVFPGPSRVLTRVVPFERTATASFYVADGPPPACDRADCDNDGLEDRLETGCPEDADGDGRPNVMDADSDNDEILDGAEGTGDVDLDGRPDYCDAASDPDSLAVAIEAEEAAVEKACDADAAEHQDRLRASLSAVRRIVQVMRTHPGVPSDVRTDAVARLDKVIGLKKQAVVLGEVLPDFCRKYRTHLEQALVIERDLRTQVDRYLAESPR